MENAFQLTGGPLDGEAGHRAVMAHIGRGLLCWARMEQHLNLLILAVNRKHYSPALYSDTHPAAFKRKIKLLKTWFNKHPPLQVRKEDFADFTGHLKEMAKIRNILAHGILESIDSRKGTAVFRSIGSKENGKFEMTCTTIPLAVISRLAYLSNVANTYLTDITHKLCCEDGEKLLRLPT